MKASRILFFMILLLAGGAAASAQNGEDPKAEAKRMLAIRAAAQDIASWILTMDTAGPAELEQLRDGLASHMVEHVDTFRTNAEGLAPAKGWLVKNRKDAFDAYITDAVARAGEQSPLTFDRDDVKRMAGTDWSRDVDTKARAFAEKTGHDLYNASRPRAIDRLKRKLIENQSWPDQSVADRMITELDRDVRGAQPEPIPENAFRQLAKPLSAMLVPGGDVFEELDNERDSIAKNMSAVLAGQYRDQAKTIAAPWDSRRDDDALRIRPRMYERLLGELHKSVSAAPDTRPPRYGVFEAVVNLAGDVALKWERRSFRRYLESDLSWMPRPEDVRDRILDDLQAHRSPGASLEGLSRDVSGETAGMVRETYARGAAAEERAAVLAYLKKTWSSPDGLEAVHRDVIDARLKGMLPSIREQIAADQMRDSFPALQQTERLPENVITWLYDRNQEGVRDFKDAWKALDADDASRPVGIDPLDVLDETQIMVTDTLNKRVRPGLDALTRQLALIRDLEEDGREQLKKEAAEGRPVEDLLESWTRDWQKAWGRNSNDVPKDWRPMFDRTRDQLNKTVRQWFASLEPVEPVVPPETMAKAEIPDESSPEMTRIDTPKQKDEGKEKEEPAEEEKEPEDQEQKPEVEPGILAELMVFRGAADGVLSFSDLPDGSCRLLFGAPDGRGAMEVSFDPEKIESSARRIADALREPLRDVLNGEETSRGGFFLFKRDNEPKLSMLFRVDSPSIRHQMSIMVREFMAEEIQMWAEETGEQPPELLWQDETGLR